MLWTMKSFGCRQSHLLFLFLSLSVAAASSATEQPAGQLVQLTLLYRHGERTPVHSFSTDPHRARFRPLGGEQLLEAGVRQHHLLGRYLRRRYAGLLPRRFNVTTMHVRSTDTDRTIMSAQANLAGLFPDQCRWSDDSLPGCYPMPIHTVPKPTDQLLKMSAPCPAYKRHWREFKRRPGGVYAAASERFAGLAERARVATGWPGRAIGISELWKIADPVAVWRTLGLALPAWLDAATLAGLDELRHLKFAWKFSEPALYASRMGALVARLVGDLKARLAGKSGKILQVYSAHDSTVSAFLHAFGVFNGLQPPIAACVMLELYSDGEVRLHYLNTTAELAADSDSDSTAAVQLPHRLHPPFCPEPCKLPRLEAEMRRRGVWADSPESMCDMAAPQPPAGFIFLGGWPAAGLVLAQSAVILCLVWLLLLARRRQNSSSASAGVGGANGDSSSSSKTAIADGARGKAKNC